MLSFFFKLTNLIDCKWLNALLEIDCSNNSTLLDPKGYSPKVRKFEGS